MSQFNFVATIKIDSSWSGKRSGMLNICTSPTKNVATLIMVMIFAICSFTVQTFAGPSQGTGEIDPSCAKDLIGLPSPGDTVPEADDVEEIFSAGDVVATDGRTAFLNSMGKIPRVADEEWPDLIARRDAGDPSAVDRIVLGNLRLLVSVAKKYVRPDSTLLDTIQMGYKGLRRAAELYDPNVAEFSTYAYQWIRAAITAEYNQGRLLKVPKKIRLGVERYRDYLASMPPNDRVADDVTIARVLGISTPELFEIKNAHARPLVPIDAFSRDGSGETVFVPDVAGVVFDDSADREELDLAEKDADKLVLSAFELGMENAQILVQHLVLHQKPAGNVRTSSSNRVVIDNTKRLFEIPFARDLSLKLITSRSSRSDLTHNFASDLPLLKRTDRRLLFDPVTSADIFAYNDVIEKFRGLVEAKAKMATRNRQHSEMTESEQLNQLLQRLPELTRQILSSVYGAVLTENQARRESPTHVRKKIHELVAEIARKNSMSDRQVVFEYRRGLFAMTTFVEAMTNTQVPNLP
jgi:RNA polymerase sigma factor (sigma-70 family)